MIRTARLNVCKGAVAYIEYGAGFQKCAVNSVGEWVDSVVCLVAAEGCVVKRFPGHVEAKPIILSWVSGGRAGEAKADADVIEPHAFSRLDNPHSTQALNGRQKVVFQDVGKDLDMGANLWRLHPLANKLICTSVKNFGHACDLA